MSHDSEILFCEIAHILKQVNVEDLNQYLYLVNKVQGKYMHSLNSRVEDKSWYSNFDLDFLGKNLYL